MFILFEKIQELYWKMRSRYCSHTWIDMDELLAHAMFEILSRYVEKEMDIIDWDYNDEHRHAKSEIMSLYHWWHDNYNKSYIEDGLRFWAETHKYMPEITWKPCNDLCVEMVTTWKNPEDEKKYRELMDESIALDAKHEAELKANMIRLITIKQYLWS